jgi:hypothetical protein
MKVGQLWFCKALRAGCTLEVTRALRLLQTALQIPQSVTNQDLLATAPARLV